MKRPDSVSDKAWVGFLDLYLELDPQVLTTEETIWRAFQAGCGFRPFPPPPQQDVSLSQASVFVTELVGHHTIGVDENGEEMVADNNPRMSTCVRSLLANDPPLLWDHSTLERAAKYSKESMADLAALLRGVAYTIKTELDKHEKPEP